MFGRGRAGGVGAVAGEKPFVRLRYGDGGREWGGRRGWGGLGEEERKDFRIGILGEDVVCLFISR